MSSSWWATSPMAGRRGVTKTEKGLHLPKETSLFMPLAEENPVRDYTLIFDVKAANVTNYISLFQTNLNNNDDGELFISQGTLGINTANLGYGGELFADVWYRIAVAVRNGVISTYINGELIKTSSHADNDHWCLNKEGVFLFLDNDGEHNDLEVAGIHFWKQPLTDEQLRYLGKVK